jgi:asparagine synthase (glutamine-hydrolysing)
MPGFLAEIANKINSQFGKDYRNLIIENFNNPKYYIERRTVNKFLNDKIFEETNRYIVLTEGIILNSLKLINRYKKDNLFHTIIYMYEKNGNEFFNEFRGSFSGLFYDKRKNIWLIYTNHIGDKQIFYSILTDKIIIGSEINFLVEYYKNNSLTYNLDNIGAYFLLTYGFMLEDYTLFKEFKKLNAGHYIKIENNKYEIKQYYRLNNTPKYKQTENDIIDNIDRLFRNAISLEFEKDNEYKLKHIVTLSGGLDSRMTTWVAHDLGYIEQLNVTFSQSNYLDETIAKKIASDLKHEWIFKTLDNGLFLKNIEEIIKINFGNIAYYGLAHSKSCLDLIDLKNFGIIHSGQLGDVIIGTFYDDLNPNKQYCIGDGAYSNKLINRLNNINLKYNYENQEIFKFYGRCFTGANQGNLVSQEITETFSPFYDLEFLNYCLSIPVKFRFKHNIYKKWIIKKYPEATKYKWEKINTKITSPHINFKNKEIYLSQLPDKIFRKISKLLKIDYSKNGIYNKKHMNPLGYWYLHNNDLKKFCDNYFNENIELIEDNNLKLDCNNLYNNGNAIEKNQVLSLLSAIRIYFYK